MPLPSLSLATDTTTGTYIELSNELNYVFKKDAAGVTKTDDVNVKNGGILSGNELIPTTNPVYADKVWAESEILRSGPVTACATTSSLGEPTKVAVSCYNSSTLQFTKLASIWGTGTVPGTSSGNSKLRGISWQTGLTNWIPAYFGATYNLIFYAVPRGQAFTSVEYNNGSPATAVAQGISTLVTPYVFDYTTGVLTFTNAAGGAAASAGTSDSPAILVGPNSWNLCQEAGTNQTAYDIYMTQGYRYTGANLSSGGTGGTVDFDLDMIKNIGRRAWIEGITGTITFDPTTSTATHNLMFIGNGSHYTVKFGYSSITSPNIDSVDAIYEYNGPQPPAEYSYAYPMDGIFNNNWNPANGYPHDLGTFGPHAIKSPSPTTINVPVTVHTNVAGGTGTRITTFGGMYGGSKYVLTIPLTMSATDLMGNPYIVTYNQTFTIAGTTLTIDGFKYYTTGAIVTIPATGLTLGNIYHVISPPTLNAGNLNTFMYATYTTTSDTDNLTNLLDTDKPGNPAFSLTPPITPGDNGDYYSNSSAFQLHVNATTIGLTLTNLLNKTSGTTYSKLFPIPASWGGNTWGSLQNYIGYLANAPGTGETNLSIGGSIGLSILPKGAPVATRLSVTGLTTVNGVSVPAITGSPQWATIVLGPSYAPSTYDAIYNPFGNPASAPLSGTFNATDFFTPLAANYIVPPKSAQPNPATIFPTGGTKYLLFAMDNSGPLITFPIKFGNSSTGLNIKNISVYWYIADSGAPGQQWWSVVKNNINVDHGTSGAGGGWDWKTATVAMNDVMSVQYSTYYKNNNPTQTSIFVCVEFSGTLNISEILVG